MPIDASIPLQVRPPADPLEQYGRFMQLKNMGQQQQMQEQQIKTGAMQQQQMQMDMDSQKAIMRAYTESSGDLDKTVPLAAKYGAKPDALIKLRQAAMQTQEQNIQLLNAKGARALQEADIMQGAHDQVAAAPPEQKPQAYQAALMGLQKYGIDVSQMPTQYPGDQAFNMLGMGLKAHSSQLAELAKQAGINKDNADTAKANAQAQTSLAELPGVTAKAELERRIAAGANAQGMTAKEQLDAKFKQQEMGIQGGRLAEERRHNQAVEGALDPQGLDTAAELYFQTGQMPTGMRSAAMVSKIINRATQLHPNAGQEIAGNKAVLKSNTDSLVSMQKQRDAVVAYENTANKNLDLFLSTAGKVVDSGSPLANTPLRLIDNKMLGSQDVAAYEAARRVAVNEIAKVTNNPGLTGQLSDQGRKEVESFNPDNATLKQTYAVAKILRADMKNRHDSMDQMIGDIQGRIRGGAPSGGSQQQGGGGGIWGSVPGAVKH